MILKYLFLIKDKLCYGNLIDMDNIINANNRFFDMIKSNGMYNDIYGGTYNKTYNNTHNKTYNNTHNITSKNKLTGGDRDEIIQHITEITQKIKKMQNIREKMKIDDFREIVNVSIEMLKYLAETKQKYGEEKTRELQDQIVRMVESLEEFI